MAEKIKKARAKITPPVHIVRDALDIHPKVKVPAVVGFVATIVLAVAAAVGTGVPAILPITSAVTTAVTTLTGYFTYGDGS